MAFGLPLVGSLLGDGGLASAAAGFTDTGSAVSGATLGAVTVGGLNPAPRGFELTPVSVGVGLALAAVVIGFARRS